MLGAPLPPARVAKTANYRVRVFQAPPKDRILDMIRGMQSRGELPAGARPKELAHFEVRANTEAGAAQLARAGILKRGHSLRAFSRSTGNEFVAYIVDPVDLQSAAPRSGA